MENREIKFRVFCKYRKEMLTVGVDHNASFNSDGTITTHGVFGDNPLMQFTGMSDESGIDIYENDIVVSYKKPYEDIPSENIVKFVGGCWKLVCKGKNDIPLYNYKPINLRIIGNIFNTPSHI